MSWCVRDVNGICEYCGKPYIKKANHQKYCEECRDEARRRDSRERHRAAREKQKAAKGTKKEKQSNQAEFKCCKKMRTCIYAGSLYTQSSSARYCNYIGITGHSRGCKPSECDKYIRKQRKGVKK